MGHATDQSGPEPTPVTADAHATVAELHQRAATDYANGWGAPDVRAAAESDGVH